MTRAPLVALAAALLSSSCGAALMSLPSGAGLTASDGREALAEATTTCHAANSFTAQAYVSGSVNGQRVRATLLVGFEADAVRLEAVAYSQPVFLFVSHGTTASLLLQQDNRAIQDGPADGILAAVTGVPLRTDTLKSTLTGCTVLSDRSAVQQPDENWRVVPDADGAVYLQRARAGAPWVVAAATHRDASGGEWRAEFRKVKNGLPYDIRLVGMSGTAFNLHLTLSQVETNVSLDSRAFTLSVPASASPITLDELRRSGPMGGTPQTQKIQVGGEIFAGGR